MKKKILPVLIAVGLILLITAGYFGAQFIKRYIPTKETIGAEEIFGVSGDDVALILDQEVQETRGLYVEGETYLPLAWVNEYLNERFYWDETENQLVYALPDSIVYANHETMGAAGKPLLWVNEDGVYLSLPLVETYTDIHADQFDDGEVKRIYIDDTWADCQVAVLKKDGKVRDKGGIKSPIMTSLEKGTTVQILDTMDNWSEVQTPDGFTGYIQNRLLKDIHTEAQVSTFEKPVYTHKLLDEKVRLAWHQVTTMEANNALEKLVANTKGLNVISPTWYALSDNEGNYKSYASKTYVEKAHSMGLQVWALVDNFSKDVQTEVLLASTTRRAKLIDSLMKEAAEYGFDGINLDFEGLKTEAGVHYIQFIRELSIACRKAELILSIDNYVPAVYNRFYDQAEQGNVADYVIIMGYDEHYAGGDMGSVASYDYVKKGIEDMLTLVPKEQVINAIPLYTRVWTKASDDSVSSQALGISKAKEWVESNSVNLYWQDSLGQYYGEKETDGGKMYIWMEEEKSIGLKMELIRDNDLAGVACWKLGFEPADLWDEIQYTE